MAQTSRPWQGTAPGDAGAYSAQQWQILHQYIVGHGASRANVGVLGGSGIQPSGALRVQAQAVPTASIDVLAGAALVQGIFYLNTATVAFLIAANASGNPRIDTVVLRADYALQTVRLAVLQGTPAASPTVPALTQSANVLWEIPLADVAVANGFVTITQANITSRAELANAPSGVYLDNIKNNSGGTLNTGDVVVLDSTSDRSVTTTTTASDKTTIGVWVGRTANGSYGRVLAHGIGYVNCSGAITRGQTVSTTTVAKQAAANTSYGGAVLGIALETTSGAGLCLCYIRVAAITEQNFVQVQDQKASGTAPANITAAAWRTREINTEVADTGNLATILSNQVTLQPGRYAVFATAPTAAAVSNNRLRVRNVTAGATIAQGSNVFNSSTTASTMTAFGVFVITVASLIELQHWATGTGLGGAAVTTGDVEVYGNMTFTRLGDF